MKKHIKSFGLYESQQLNEAETRPGDPELVDKFVNSMYREFGKLTYDRGGKDDKYYDYSNSHIHISNRFFVDNWDWCDPTVADNLIYCNISSPRTQMVIRYTEVISPDRGGEFVPASAHISVSTNNTLKYFTKIVIDDPKKANFDKLAKDFLSKSKKGSKKMDDGLIERLLSFWKPLEKEYKHKSSSSIGIGRHASTHITKSYDKIYRIEGLDKSLFGGNRKKCEETISKHYMFKRDNLKFDWDGGVMIVNGEYTEVWD